MTLQQSLGRLKSGISGEFEGAQQMVKTFDKMISITWWRQANRWSSIPSLSSRPTHTPFILLVFTEVVSKHIAWTFSTSWHSTKKFWTAFASFSLVPELIFGTSNSLSIPSPETKTGSLSTEPSPNISGSIFPFQWITNGQVGSKLSFIALEISCLALHRARWIVLREIGCAFGSWPRAAAIGISSRTASRSDVLLRSKALVTLGLNNWSREVFFTWVIVSCCLPDLLILVGMYYRHIQFHNEEHCLQMHSHHQAGQGKGGCYCRCWRLRNLPLSFLFFLSPQFWSLLFFS